MTGSEMGSQMGVYGAIIGSILGVFGGVVGCYFGIKNTNGPRERAFVIKYAIWMWVAVAVMIGAILFIESPLRWVVWPPYMVALPFVIRRLNARQMQLREEEAVENKK